MKVKRFITYSIITLFALLCLQITAHAQVVGTNPVTFKVGEYKTEEYTDNEGFTIRLEPNQFPPAGVSIEIEDEIKPPLAYIRGTALPGTVNGEYKAVLDSKYPIYEVKIYVVIGPQAIVLADVASGGTLSKELGDSFTLAPYSKDASNQIIDVALRNPDFFGSDQTLIADHQPSYIYSSSEETVATVAADGTVNMLKTGDTIITISSAATESYEAAADYTFTLTVTDDSTDATLKTVAGQTITAGNEAGSYDAPKTASVSVANSVSSLTAADIVPNYENATATFGDAIDVLDIGDVSLDVGDNTVYVEVTAEDGTTKLYYKITITRAAAALPPPSPGTTTPQQPTAKIGDVDVNYTIGSDGTVTLTPTAAQLEKLLETIGTDGVLNITVSGIEGMKSAVIEIDLSKLTASDMLQVFSFSVADMEISFPAGALRSMQKLAKTLRFGLKPGSLIFELTDTSGKAVEWYDYANPVTVSMDYEPPQDISTHQVVMTRKDGSIVPRSWYSGGKVYARVSEPGRYDAAVKPLGNFTDTAGLWMDEAASYMSARGIVEGVGGGLFDRGGTITRAHFVTMLMRALDVQAAADDDALPADYADAPEWARSHIAAAAVLGLTLEDKDGNFNPDAAITRQEMFFMAYQAMQSCGMLPVATTTQFIIFTDWDDITDEYGGALQTMAILGLVNGNGDGTLNPNGSSTRAEGAQFLYNILKYDMKR